MSAIIKVSDLWKRYWIRHQAQPQYRALRDDIADLAAKPLRALRRRFSRDRDGLLQKEKSQTEEFWALRDVSFEIERGDVVGIIGSNGAGKSTLLKILSRITEPTRGRIEIDGRVVSLLEVGTGFHPELTGRENIYLNGAILGMSRSEVRHRFDEIVDFAEIAKFLDTPVKRYSSGMYVRLAFAVAAHLEPDILVVDEVLAVGDAQFQKKCLGKMREVSTKDGRTVLFVTHQMGTVRQLCTRAILLKSGQVEKLGSVTEVIDTYMALQHGGRGSGFEAGAIAKTKDIALERAWTSNERGEATPYFVHNESVVLHVVCRLNRWVSNAELRIFLEDSRGRRVFVSDLTMQAPLKEMPSVFQAKAKVPAEFLRPETYFVRLWTFVPNLLVIDDAPNALSFIVQDGGSKYAATEGIDYGCVFSPCEWVISEDDQNETVAS
jgi:lipopolysaccharide transport system ATP-binding protein